MTQKGGKRPPSEKLWYKVEFQNAEIYGIFYLRAPFILLKLILVFPGVSEMHCLCGDWLPFVPFSCSVVSSGLERLEDKGRKWVLGNHVLPMKKEGQFGNFIICLAVNYISRGYPSKMWPKPTICTTLQAKLTHNILISVWLQTCSKWL